MRIARRSGRPGWGFCSTVLQALALAAGLAALVVAARDARADTGWHHGARAAIAEARAVGQPGLDSSLGQMAAAARAGRRAQALALAEAAGIDAPGGLVRVIAEGHVSPSQAAGLGGRVEAEVDGRTQVVVPPAALPRLAAFRSVDELRVPRRPRPLALTGEGVDISGASRAHANGTSGTGTTIAVIDVGFAGYAQRVTDGELPAGLGIYDFCGGGLATASPHGTGVAEIVHETAPGASLLLICIDSEVTLAQAVDAASAAGAQVIVHSVGWYGTSRGDGSGADGSPDAIAAAARLNGVLWINAAGNDGQAHRTIAWRDADDDELSDTGTFNYAQPPGARACVLLKWDAWPVTTEDFDLVLVSYPGQTVLAVSASDQASGPTAPVEEACWTNTTSGVVTVEAVVARFSAVTEPSLDLYVDGGVLGVPNDGLSVVEPASSGAVIAVGARCASGISELPTPYSAGGTTIDLRPKPDILGVDSVSSATYGVASTCGSGFAGTSAAAPLVAGVAALIRQENPAFTPDQVEARLLRSTLPTTATVGRIAMTEGVSTQELALVWSQRPANDRVLVTSAEGGAAWDLRLGDAIAGGDLSDVAWSPDGTRIAVVRSNSEVWLLNVDGSNATRLANGVDVAWTPAGTSVVYVGWDREIHRIGTDGTGDVVLTSNALDEQDPDVAPDGRIVYSANASGTSAQGVFVMNADGTNVQQLQAPVPGGSAASTEPDWSPDGSEIAFVASTAGFAGVRIMAADGTDVRNVLSNASSPDWSPDGTQLAVAHTSAGVSGVATVGIDGTGLRDLHRVAGTVSTFGPAWRPGALRPPEVVRAPTVDGVPTSRRIVRANVGTWLGGPMRYSFQWQLCNRALTVCSDISGETRAVYSVPQGSAVSGYLGIRVTATNAAGSTSATAGAVSDIYTSPPWPVTKPTIVGTGIVGQQLEGRIGSATAPVIERWWRLCGTNGGFCTDIPGATGFGYVPSAADVGFTVRFVTRVQSAGGYATNTSLALPIVANANPAGGGSGGGGGDGGGGGGNLPDLQVLQSADRSTAAAGDQVLFRIEASMKNPTQSSGASNLVLTDVLPANVDFVSVRTNRGSCVGGRTVTCNLSAINGLLVAQVELVVKVTGPGEIVNSAVLRADETDPDLTNNTATVRLNAPVVTPTPTPRPNPTPTPAPKPRPLSLKGTAKAETLRGGSLADVLDGGAGADRLFGLAGNDRLIGGAGNDVADGGAGVDRLLGQAGNDRLTGGSGKDVVDGGAGDDTILVRDREKDTVRCGAGRDTVTADKVDVVARDCEVVKRA